MRTWSRLTGVTGKPCGRCGRAIAVGDPQLLITRPGQTWSLRRCASCAGEPVPAVPPLPPAPHATTAYADEHQGALVMASLNQQIDQ